MTTHEPQPNIVLLVLKQSDDPNVVCCMIEDESYEIANTYSGEFDVITQEQLFQEQMNPDCVTVLLSSLAVWRIVQEHNNMDKV